MSSEWIRNARAGEKRRCDEELPRPDRPHQARRLLHSQPELDRPPSAVDFAALQARVDAIERQFCNRHTIRDENEPLMLTPSDHNIDDPNNGSSVSVLSTETHSLHTCSAFPVSAFLDISRFDTEAPSEKLCRPDIRVPESVLLALDQSSKVRSFSDEYFKTVHIWFRFISAKKQFETPFTENSQPDLVALALAMRLVTSSPDDNTSRELYGETKSYLCALESGGFVSLPTLQAMILATLYEYCHAVYPAAWMSIGACTRYIELLGVSWATRDTAFQGSTDTILLGEPTLWFETDEEERRRSWWAVFILDRLMSVGSKRPCALSRPQEDMKLPMHDDKWESRNYDKNWEFDYQIYPIIAAELSGFSRLCEAALFTDRALVLSRVEGILDQTHLENVICVSRKIQKWIDIIDQESNSPSRPDLDLRLMGPRFAARSALFLCLKKLTFRVKITPDGPQILDLQNEVDSENHEAYKIQLCAARVVWQASLDVRNLAKAFSDQLFDGQNPIGNLGIISPFVLDAVYNASANLHRLSDHKDANQAYHSDILSLATFLDELSMRWRSAGEYRKLCEKHLGSTQGLLAEN
ncbi:hypothetical protein CORC01_06354 [Colletotrichum orchidophilum]|uniref:Xylanolytic transcriptional activator regulatory domain-containing protein n=1 Tax=Colletotrichum orchidophilum TaxID=1209926 RepID=A0A1G4BAF4_9PEZI|nr:uncharacterized protein CORC01_06354 [Colletotrichum orchidophilum]OHE98358.1 hypothetical protein CORC01_06354 [Colletotrichum orchidophilum]